MMFPIPHLKISVRVEVVAQMSQLEEVYDLLPPLTAQLLAIPLDSWP
jgi:hypothetical protein